MPVFVSMNLKASNNPEAALAFKKEVVAEATGHPVLFGMQELDINAPRSGLLNVPQFLAQGDAFQFSSALLLDASSLVPLPAGKRAGAPWRYGVALIASGVKIGSTHHMPLGPTEASFWSRHPEFDPAGWEFEPRKALLAEVKTGKKPCWVAVVHLSHKQDRTKPSRVRKEQVEALTKALTMHVPRKAPLVVLGDLGTTPDNGDLNPLLDSLRMVELDEPTKFIKGDKPLRVDYVLYRNMTPTDAPKLLHLPFSDHKALRVSLEP